MSTISTRRDFLKFASFSALSSAAGLQICRTAIAADSDDKPLYAFPLLGDIHYDRRDHHDFDWLKQNKIGDLNQIEGYIATTEKYTPRLLADVAQQVKDLKAKGISVPFVLQLGDLVEGLCGSFDLQTKQFDDALGAVDRAALGAPVLMVKGNHDVTGPGAAEAFDKSVLPWLSKQAGKELKSASYVHRQGDDLFVCFDAYKPDLFWLEKALATEKDTRHVFFVIHPPVIPYNARAEWHIYAKEKSAADRARLLALLGSRKATILSGHLHKFSALARRTPTGPVGQLAICSVVRSEKETPKGFVEGIERYGPSLVELEPQHSPETVDRRKELLKQESAFVDAYAFADTAGYAIAKVWRDRVTFDLYCGVGQPVWRTDVSTVAKAKV